MDPTALQSQILSVNAGYWSSIDGDRTLRLDYDIDKNATVFDLGGYQGDWSEQIYQRYGCRIFVFEPVPDFSTQISRRFRDNASISVFSYALGPADGTLELSLNENATSSYAPGARGVVEAKVRDFAAFLEEKKIQEIDLLKINIEGGEFELLDYLIATGWISRIRHVQVQFHGFVPGADALVENIRRRLSETHVPTYSLDWVWESWKRTPDSAARKAALEDALQWHRETLSGMSAFASAYAIRNKELEELNGLLAVDSGILNEWRRRLAFLLRVKNFFRTSG